MNGEKIPNGTRIQFQPLRVRDAVEAKHALHRGHSGIVIDYTTDGFYRVRWDMPNPDPQLFSLGTVFRPEDLFHG